MMRKNIFPILMYHSISNMPKGTIMRSLHVHPKRFKFQMYMLKLLGYRGVSMTELKPYLIGKKSGRVVGLTFDDGYKNNLIDALPVLKKIGFSATLYLVSANIGAINNWDSSKGIPEKRLMNEIEVKEWIDSGMEIGSHTQSHIDLQKCSNEIAFKEINQSKADLENNFKTTINHFCYPYGNFNKTTLSIVKQAGYDTATTTSRGRSATNDDILELPRVSITHHTLPHLFLLKLFSKYEDRRGN